MTAIKVEEYENHVLGGELTDSDIFRSCARNSPGIPADRYCNLAASSQELNQDSDPQLTDETDHLNKEEFNHMLSGCSRVHVYMRSLVHE